MGMSYTTTGLGAVTFACLELETVLEQTDPGEDVETQPSSGHGDHQSPDVPQVADIVCPDKREEDVVVLLALVLVHSSNLVRHSYQGVPGTPSDTHVLQQRLLTVVGGEDGDLVGGVAEQSHEHVDCNNVLSLSEVLVEERTGLTLSNTIEVGNVDQLVVETEAGVGDLVVGVVEDVREVPE